MLALLVLAGCGESSNKSASVSSAATTASNRSTRSTTGRGSTTPQTTSTSTATKPSSSASGKQSTTPAATSTGHAATSTNAGKPAVAKRSSQAAKHASHEKPLFGKISVSSPAFKADGPIPVKYTCDGANVSPPLEWGPVPHGTAEIMILAIDLAGSSSDVIQWAVAGISPRDSSIPEGSLPAGAVAGVNSEGKVGWGGICGAKGQQHRVGFLFYALDHPLGLKSGFDPIEVREGLKGSILGTGLTLGTYQRSS